MKASLAANRWTEASYTWTKGAAEIFRGGQIGKQVKRRHIS
jgi:hypothetical protein